MPSMLMLLNTLGAVVALTTASLTAGPVPAEDANNFRASVVQSVHVRIDEVTQIEQRLDELLSAYDSDTRQLDSSAVSHRTLSSDMGRAFVAAVSQTSGRGTTRELAQIFATLRRQLEHAGAEQTQQIDGDVAMSTASLANGISVTYPIGRTLRISGGSDPWPYIQLTNSEQQAMVTGASGALIASICALLGPETAGVGCGVGAAVIAMIVGILVANGVCSKNRQMRIYPLAGPTGFSCQ